MEEEYKRLMQIQEKENEEMEKKLQGLYTLTLHKNFFIINLAHYYHRKEKIDQRDSTIKGIVKVYFV